MDHGGYIYKSVFCYYPKYFWESLRLEIPQQKLHPSKKSPRSRTTGSCQFFVFPDISGNHPSNGKTGGFHGNIYFITH